jgi:hypothetical protein
MVTMLTQISIDVSDIDAVQFKCKCGAALSLHPAGPLEAKIPLGNNREMDVSLPPALCPQCSGVWFPDNRKIRDLLNALKEIRHLKGVVTISFVASENQKPASTKG